MDVMMTLEEALRYVRSDPRYAQLLFDSYLGTDAQESAERFRASAEFKEVRRLLQGRLGEGRILDLGAGTGIASYAFAQSEKAVVVYAVEPNASDNLGCGVIRRLPTKTPIEVLNAFGEEIPLPDEHVDIVYAREVLHHARALPQLLQECARVLKPGGVLLACREHVVDDERQLAEFLANHPVHALAGSENAFALDVYLGAIRAAGLVIEKVLGPWDTVINAFPTVRTTTELRSLSRTRLESRFGRLGVLAGRLPGVNALIRAQLNHSREPGRMYSFLAAKPT